jgi:cytochrome c-type biogenesis protein CcmH
MKSFLMFFSGKRLGSRLGKCCRLSVLALLCGGFVFTGAAALAADARPVDEPRFLHLAGELRCLVCQNQSLADSSAGLAVDLRAQIHEQMAAGKTDAEIRAYMVARYGDFVLYSPPLKATTWLLWFGPFISLLMAFGLGIFLLRRRAGLAEAAATQEAKSDTPLPSKAEARWQKENP